MNIAPQIRFIITSSKAKLSQSDIEYIRDYISKYIIDNTAVDDTIATISRHGLIPLVYHTLRDLSSDIDIPSTLLSKLQARYKLIAQKNMLMSAELIKIVKLLAKHDIKTIPFKGPSLAQLAYGDITLRVFGDLDILVEPNQIYDAGVILTKHNYICDVDISFLHNTKLLDISSDLGFRHQTNHTYVELHWKLFRKKLSIDFIDLNIFTNYTTLDINKHQLQTLEINTLLIYLCIHGSKHMWERVGWIVDIDKLITQYDINWDLIKNVNNKTPVYLGLYMSYKLYDTPIPKEILSHIQHHNKIKSLYKQTIHLWSNHIDNKMKFKFDYHAQLMDSKFEYYKYYFKTLFGITQDDILYKNLSEKYHILYIILRPIRLISKYLK
jgi:hypothetical protein